VIDCEIRGGEPWTGRYTLNSVKVMHNSQRGRGMDPLRSAKAQGY